MTALSKHLREQAAIFRQEDSLGRGAKELDAAADLIEQQAAKIAELATDLERTRNERNAAHVQARREIHKEHRDYIAELEAQRARLTARPVCVDCGDTIMAHDPGTCGTCHAIKYAAPVATAVDAQPVARVCVESLKPGQEFNTKYYGRVRFIRWDHYMGQRTAEIEKLDFGGRCNPLPETLQESIDACASAQSEGLRKDAERYRWIRDVLRLDDVRWMNVANWNQANISAEVWDSEIDAALSQHTGEKS